LRTSAAGLLTCTAIGATATTAGAEETNETSDGNETETDDPDDDSEPVDDEESDDEESDDEESDDEESDDEESSDDPTCGGEPTMSRTSVTTPNSQITTDDPAIVEANFRPDPTIPEDCTIFVDLEFSFSDAGFQWGGGADWDQATSDLVVGTFEVRPGEVRDIRAELHTQGAEEGDEVTVVADYEIWFEGHRDESVQQSGIRHTIDVESPNPADDEQGTVESFTPGLGIPSAIAGLGGAAYLFKSKLGRTDE